MMTAIEYLRAKQRMTKKCTMICNECPFSINNNASGCFCLDFERNNAEKAIEIVENWAKQHPIKTFLTDFKEKYPNAPMDTNGTPNCCPHDLGYTDNADKDDCNMDCKDCWNRELEDDKNEETK